MLQFRFRASNSLVCTSLYMIQMSSAHYQSWCCHGWAQLQQHSNQTGCNSYRHWLSVYWETLEERFHQPMSRIWHSSSLKYYVPFVEREEVTCKRTSSIHKRNWMVAKGHRDVTVTCCHDLDDMVTPGSYRYPPSTIRLGDLIQRPKCISKQWRPLWLGMVSLSKSLKM